MKASVFDDAVLLTGANLSAEYFEARQDLLRVRVRSRVGGRVRGGVRAEDADRVLLVGTAHGVVLVRVRVRG